LAGPAMGGPAGRGHGGHRRQPEPGPRPVQRVDRRPLAGRRDARRDRGRRLVTEPPGPDLVVVGDVMLDVSVASSALARGGDVHGEVRIRPGGSAANAAAWAAAAGVRVALYGAVGDDPAGRLLGEALEAASVEARLRVVPGARTGAMLVVHGPG